MTKRMMLLLVLLFCTTVAGAAETMITVKLTVPDAAWTVAIEEVHKVEDSLWVISSVAKNSDIMGAQVISTVQDSVKITVPNLPVKNFIIGKTWAWENTEPYTFISDIKQIEKKLKSGKRLYPAAQRSTDPQLILNKTWQWEATTTPVEKIHVPNPERYTIILKDEGSIQAQFDCNRGGGTYEISDNKLSFGPLMSTRMACPEGSLDRPFVRDLQRTFSFFIDNGHLYLELPYDSGTMKFRPAPNLQPAFAEEGSQADSKINYGVIAGEWQRTDGIYQIKIKDVNPDGQASVSYFNPRPIHIEKADISTEKNLTKLFIKFQDKGYEGSTYKLYYFAPKDALVGFYHQATMNKTYEVIFLRKDL